MTTRSLPWTVPALTVALLACSNTDEPGPDATLAIEALMNPDNCQDCHQNHVREWKSSMHAYAAEDPIFLAMNRRGQEETGYALGDFCVQCHAPLAVALGRTENGLNLDELEPELKGVNCYFCHNVDAVSDVHDNPLMLPANNPLQLAMDNIMRGGLTDDEGNPNAVEPSVHRVAYSAMHDGDNAEASSELCGTCHDIVTEKGVHLERTYSEFQSSVFAPSTSCIGCHMDGYSGVAAVTDDVEVPGRRVGIGSGRGGLHSHMMPGVDTALTPFPDREIQVKAIECALKQAVQLSLLVQPDGSTIVTLETDVGHGWPSGATQDRRAWLELVAYNQNGDVIFEVGKIADDEPVLKSPGDPGYQERLVTLHDRIFNEAGEEVHMFWDAAPSDEYPEGRQTPPRTLPPRTPNGLPPHVKEFPFNLPQAVSRIEAQVHIRAIGHDLLDDLVESGHLTASDAAQYKAELKTHTVSSSYTTWDLARGDSYGTVTKTDTSPLSCPNQWFCELYPNDPACLTD